MNAQQRQNRWIERGLLILVLMMQSAILWQLHVDRSNQQAVEPLVPAADTPDHSVLQQQESTGRRLESSAVDPIDHMVENIARLHAAMIFNDGWDRLPASPTLDMRDTENGYLVTCSIPGLRPDDLGVLLEGRVLTVRALCGSDAGRNQIYERRILLPGPVGSAEQAEALVTNGVLRVHVPKGTEPGSTRMVLRLF